MLDALSKFANLPASPARQEHIVKIKNTVNHIRGLIDKDEEIEVELKSKIEELSEQAKVRAKRKFHPNVTLRIGHQLYKTTRPREAGFLQYEEGEINYSPANIKD